MKKIYVLAIGVVNINTGKTMYDWSIYESPEYSSVFLTSQGFLLYAATGSFKIGDTYELYGNDSQRNLGKAGIIVDMAICDRDKVLEMLKKNGYDYYPIKAFRKRVDGNRKLSTSYSVK